jgi:hypothetical protein
VHDQDEYFSVDWDFKGFHGQRDKGKVGVTYNQVYRDFLTTFGQPIAKFRSSASVAIMPTIEDAIKLKKIIEKYGGTAKVRKCINVDM